jgi:hypothetical protein
MGKGRLKGVEEQLIKDLEKGTPTLQDLAEKYGVTRQAISYFALKHGVRRGKRDHTKRCSICQRLLGIAKKPGSDFISAPTIHEQLELGSRAIKYHVFVLRKNELVSRNFARMRSKTVEMAFQIYLNSKIPVATIERQLGIKNLYSVLKRYKDAGWIL